MRVWWVPDLSALSVGNFLVPSAQALLRDPEALEAATREALESILRERGGFRVDALGKAMSKSLFGEGGFLSKTPSVTDLSLSDVPPLGAQPEEGRLRRMMRVKYEEMVKGKNANANANANVKQLAGSHSHS